MIIELDIPMLPPTPNQTRGQHWSKTKATRDEAEWAVLAAWSNAGRPNPLKPFGRRARLDVVIHSSGRPGDQDNAWARMKPIIDALVHQHLLVDDRPTWLELGSIEHAPAPPKHGRVVVRLTYTTEETMTPKTPDNELPGMPERPQLPTQDGVPFPVAKIALTGGIEFHLIDQHRIDAAEQFHLEDEIELVIRGHVATKQWSVARDKDDVPIRVLRIGLRVEELPSVLSAT